MAEPVSTASALAEETPDVSDVQPASGNIAHPVEVSEFFGSLHPAFSRTLLYIVLAFVLSGLLWVGFGKVDVVATAPFRLVPRGRVNTVQAPRGGEIESIKVKEGDRVSEGQILFKLRSRETWMELRELEQAKVQFQKADYDFREALPQKRRLTQETVAALKARLDLMQALMQTHQDALQAYRESIKEENLSGHTPDANPPEADLKAEIRFRSAELEHLNHLYTESRQLYKKRLISHKALDEARVRYFGALAALPARMAEVHRLETTVQDLKRQILQAQINRDRESVGAVHAYKEAKLRYERAQQAVDRALEADSDLILAPEAGIVTQVLVNTVGQVADKGQALATLAPASAPTVAEAMVLNKDVGTIKPGQAVKLKYEAFPFEDYGIKQGRLTQISPDATVDPVFGPVYRCIVQPEEITVQVHGEEKPLMYGLKGTAEIITDRTSILNLLLKPLRQMRESAAFAPDEEE